VTESDSNGFVERHGVIVCRKTQTPSRKGKGTSLLVPLRLRKSARALAPEACFLRPDSYLRRLFSRPSKVSLRARRLLLVTLGVALFPDASCKRQPGAERSFFPASNQVAGWTRTGEIRTFEAADLWKYIDGDAERYLKAGAQRVSTADYRFQNKVDAVADIYIMGNAEGAEKIFNSEPAVDGKAVPLGDGARLHSQSLVFRKGACLVRIVAYEESAETQQALLQLGQGIALRLAR
jgi:uncharacterized protein DUF6599